MLVGRRITGVSRLGKMIDIATSDAEGGVLHVIVHFGHDGWVLWNPDRPDGLAAGGRGDPDGALVRLEDGVGLST